MYDVLLFCSCAMFLFWMFSRDKSRKKNRLPPSLVPRSFRIIIRYLTSRCARDMIDTINDAVSSVGGIIYGWTFYNGYTCIITSGEYAAPLLKGSDHVDRPDLFSYAMYQVENSLPGLKGTEWRTDRRLLASLFSTKFLQNYQPIMAKHSRNLLEELKSLADGRSFRCDNTIQRHLLYNTIEVTTGINVPILSKEEFEHMCDVISKSIDDLDSICVNLVYSFFRYKLGLKPNMYYEFHKATQLPVDRIEEIMKEKKYQDEGAEDNLYNRVATLGDERKMAEIKTFLIVGSETTSAALSVLLAQLGIHQHEQERMYQEQLEIFGNSKRSANCEEITKMTRLDAGLSESLRLTPVVPTLARTLTKETNFGEYTLPKGTNVMIFLDGILRDPSIWEKPNEFYPDHFETELSSKRPANLFLSFSFGARNCIGQKYAIYVMKTVMSDIIRNFHIENDTNVEDLKTNRVFTFSSSKVRIKLTPRN